jgi:hypothetical protein
MKVREQFTFFYTTYTPSSSSSSLEAKVKNTEHFLRDGSEMKKLHEINLSLYHTKKNSPRQPPREA